MLDVFFFQAEDGIRDRNVTGVQTCALPISNWSGTWPGLVGMLNLNGSMTKAGIRYSSLWSENFGDAYFKQGLRQWLRTGRVSHDQSHVKDFDVVRLPPEEEELGRGFARKFKEGKAIM